MSNNLKVKVDERLDIARLVEQYKAVLFNPDLSEDQKTEAWSRILAECTSRGHHWVKGKDVTYLKKSKWPGIKRDAIEHYQADMKSDVSHRKKLTEADVMVLKAISFNTENLGSLVKKDSTCSGPDIYDDVTQPVTVEVKTGEPLNLLACGMQLSGEPTSELDKFDNGLLVNLFSKNNHETRKTAISSSDQEHRYSKRHRVDDDGPIDHDLMAALGFGKNRHRGTVSSSERCVRKCVENDSSCSDPMTTVGDYVRSVNLIPATKDEEQQFTIQCSSPIERKPSVEHPKCPISLPKVSTATSVSSVVSPKDNCRDLKSLQKRAYEAQIAREEAMTKYYQMKIRKLELEIAQLQRNRSENEENLRNHAMVLGISSFFYFFQILNNWPRLLMFVWECSQNSLPPKVPIELCLQSSSLDLHKKRLINSADDFEKYYGVVAVSACNLSLISNVTYHWQHYFDDQRVDSFESDRCYATLHCAKEGIHTVLLSISSTNGDVIGVRRRSFEVRPLWIAIIGDSFASGEGNPDIHQHNGTNAQWLDERCHRSSKSFAAQVFEEIATARSHTYLTFLACAGATVENGILKSENGEASQLSTLENIATLRFFFVSHQLDLVAERLVAVGAGSVFIPQYFDFTKNQYGEVDASCIASGEVMPHEVIFRGLIFIIQLIVFPMSTSSMTFAERRILRRLNTLLLKKGTQHGWHVVSAIPALFARRGICSSQSFIRSRQESIALQGSAMGAFHPNEAGHRVVAKEILRELRDSGVIDVF
ncbi:hypothetical protein GCK32_000453 [Trichostrongylus colubriformis]|uniref:Regulatory protein zeste n=1 Tax=Trichostrongylus colubriformis TaxID=6319 RepID=A0AAN8EUY2_TRICO